MMEEYRTGPRVILDARFVVQEQRDVRYLKTLEKMGCVLVLIDTFSHELAAFPMKDPWLHVERKLMQFPDTIECWIPTAEMLRNETTFKLPTLLPVDNYATDLTRHWFRSKEGYVPDHLDESSKRNLKQKTMNTVAALLADINNHKQDLDGLADKIAAKPFGHAQELGFHFVNDRARIIAQIMRSNGDTFAPDMFALDCPHVINERWAVFHQAKLYLALLCLYIHKFGTKVSPESIKELETVTLQSDYAIALAFAEGFALSESQTDLAKLCHWMYGGSRKLITMTKLDKILPQTLDVEHAAYYRWETWGHKHGHDTEHWHLAERKLHRFLWPTL